MKAILLTILTALSCHAGFLERLSLVESGNNDTAHGRSGEVSRWQVMEYVRRDYPGTVWTDQASARRAVVQELNARSARFMLRRGRWPTEFEQALLWHCPARVGHPTAADVDYAQRVAR